MLTTGVFARPTSLVVEKQAMERSMESENKGPFQQRASAAKAIRCQICGDDQEDEASLLIHLKICSDKKLSEAYYHNHCMLCTSFFLTKEELWLHISKCSAKKIEEQNESNHENYLTDENYLTNENYKDTENDIITSDTSPPDYEDIEIDHSDTHDDAENESRTKISSEDSMEERPQLQDDGGYDEFNEKQKPNSTLLDNMDKCCNACGKTYSSKAYLKVHQEKVHEKDSLEHEGTLKTFKKETAEKFSCGSCGKMYTSKNYLKIHKETVHEGKRPFECKACGKSFSQTGSLKMHKTSKACPKTEGK